MISDTESRCPCRLNQVWSKMLAVRPMLFVVCLTNYGPIAILVAEHDKLGLMRLRCLSWQFIEKKRELKQAGRTEAELADSYAFLLPDTSKVRLAAATQQIMCFLSSLRTLVTFNMYSMYLYFSRVCKALNCRIPILAFVCNTLECNIVPLVADSLDLWKGPVSGTCTDQQFGKSS